jgi:quercetin dioxygenase-like cupin family protein
MIGHGLRQQQQGGRAMEQTHQNSATADKRPRIVLQTRDVRVVEYTLQPGDTHSWHHHSEVTDRFYCLEGVIEVTLRGAAQTERLRPGESFMIPPGIVHRAGNGAEGVSRYLLVQGIGHYDYVKAA